MLKRAGLEDLDEWEEHMGKYRETINTVYNQQTEIKRLRRSLVFISF